MYYLFNGMLLIRKLLLLAGKTGGCYANATFKGPSLYSIVQKSIDANLIWRHGHQRLHRQILPVKVRAPDTRK